MRTVALGEVASIDRRGVDPSTLPPETRYLGLEHIERGGRIVGNESVAGANVSSTKFIFTQEHVLFGKLRPNLGKVARPFFSGVCSTDILPIRPGVELDRGYLAHYLAQPLMVDFAASRASGANLPRLSPSALATFPIPLPPVDEQRRVAAVLDHADSLRAQRRQVLAGLDGLTRSLFQDMFGALHSTATVQELAAAGKGTIRTGPFGSQLLHSEFVDDGVAVLGLDNVVSNEFSWGERRYITLEKYRQLQRYAVHPGDVLISIMGTTGRCVVVPEGVPPAINTKHLCAITPDKDRVDAEYLRATFLWHPEARAHLRRQTKGSIMAGLNMGIIKSMPVAVPSLRVQREFSTRVMQLKRQRATVERALEAEDELFASLQSRAFRGEL